MDINSLPYLLWPKQKIFLSIDVIDSTHLKTQLPSVHFPINNNSTTWTELLFNFFANTHPIFSHTYAEMKKQYCKCDKKGTFFLCDEIIPKGIQENIKTCQTPKLWKTLGDETIFTENIVCPLQPYICLKALVATVNELHQRSDEKETEINLKYKATAWVAGMPVANAPMEYHVNEELYYTESDSHGKLEKDLYPKEIRIMDAIGPSMDLGFRLTKFSTETKCVLSASMLKLLMDSHSLLDEKDCFSIYSSGLVGIKGIKDGQHPLFWVVPNANSRGEKKLFSKVKEDDLKSFLKDYFKGNEPFIFDLKDAKGPSADPDYREKLEHAIMHQGRLPSSIYLLYKHEKFGSSVDEEDGQSFVNENLEKF